MPNYRVIEVHRPNRIVVRDEKGNEAVRRASHLKIYEPKDKVAAMVPEGDEYKQFGRNTKLLLHPKDVTDLQFTPTEDKKGEIPLEVEVSLINIEVDREKRDNTVLTSESCKILPENTVKRLGTDRYIEYIVDSRGDNQITSEISPEAAINERSGNLPENPAWFQRSIICVSKWSKALKNRCSTFHGDGY